MVWRRELITGPRPNFQAPGEVWFKGGSLLRALGRIFKLRGKYGLEDGAYYGPVTEFSCSGGSMVWKMELITGPWPNFQAPGEVWFRGWGLLRPSAEFSSSGG